MSNITLHVKMTAPTAENQLLIMTEQGLIVEKMIVEFPARQ